jgi:hypothetical protein
MTLVIKIYSTNNLSIREFIFISFIEIRDFCEMFYLALNFIMKTVKNQSKS